jgi:hypothetical protein
MNPTRSRQRHSSVSAFVRRRQLRELRPLELSIDYPGPRQTKWGDRKRWRLDKLRPVGSSEIALCTPDQVAAALGLTVDEDGVSTA